MIDPTPVAAAALDIARDSLVTEVVTGVFGFLAMVASAFVAFAGKSFRAWLDAKAAEAAQHANAAQVRASIEAFKSASEKIEQLTANAVDEVEHTLVRQFKRDNKWNPEAARSARDTAVAIAIRHLGDGGMEAVQEALGHAKPVVLGMLRTGVEKRVRGMKDRDKHLGPGSSPIVSMEATGESG